MLQTKQNEVRPRANQDQKRIEDNVWKIDIHGEENKLKHRIEGKRKRKTHHNKALKHIY